jgi:methylenetetrahydrofolate dehydrogenase (NADP+)/methenyltetrahydrofolate cyclohydrolase
MILDGKIVANTKLQQLKQRVEKLSQTPKLTIIKVGNDKASERYITNKVNKCKEVGIDSQVIYYPVDTQQSIIEEKILQLNHSHKTTAILLQLPLPSHLDENYLTSLITTSKDVDGFTSENIGKLTLGQNENIACTPKGIISLLKYYDISLKNKNVLIINRSNIVGKPLAMLLLQENATVTIAHSHTTKKTLKQLIKNSDIVITGVGIPNFLEHKDFSPLTTIVDVSINFDESGKMCGDIKKEDYQDLLDKDCNITPVPGGVGQMTVISLIEQTIEIAERKEHSIK